MTIITIYYVTWLCQLSQIFVLSFANAFVFVGIYEYIDVGVIASCRFNGSKVVTTMEFSKGKSTLCMQMECTPTVLGHYTNKNMLLWQYLNGT